MERSPVHERGRRCRGSGDALPWRALSARSSPSAAAMTAREPSRELATPEAEVYIRTFKEQMHLELELPKLPGNRPTSPKISPRSSPRNSPCFFRKLLVNKSIRQRRRFTVAHTW